MRASFVGMLVVVHGLHAQEAPALQWRPCAPSQTQVLILGVFHMADDDAIVDIRTARRQAELDTLVQRLTAFAPNKVAVERPFASHDSLNALYRSFRIERGAPASRNEAWQIGFRLARVLGHERIYPVDFRMNLGTDSLASFYQRHPEARAHVIARSLEARRVDSIAMEGLKDQSVVQILRWMNANAQLENPTFFRDILPLGEGGNYAGAEMLARWYDRNLRIVQNLFRIRDASDRRILLIIGNGHVQPLKALLEATPQFCPVSATTVLDRR